MLLSSSVQQALFEDRFSGSTLSSGWTSQASSSGSVRLEDGAVVFAAPRNAYCNIARPLDKDLVTAQCRLKSAPADSWVNSLFLYWGPGDWVMLGVRPMDGGRVYMTQMADGGYSEANLGRTPFEAWTWVRIEVGTDVLRFYSSRDCKAWTLEKFSERPGSFVGSPSHLIVGKGFGGMEGYPNPLLKNDYKELGEAGVSLADDVSVFETSSGKRESNAKERAGWNYALQDGLGKLFLRQPGGPTFEAIASVLPGIRYSRETVGVPEHPFDIGVEADGTIQVGGYEGYAAKPNLWIEVGDPPVRLGSPGLPLRKSLRLGRLPIVEYAFEKGPLQFRADVFGWSEGGSPDAALRAYLVVGVKNVGKRQEPLVFRLATDSPVAGQSAPEWRGIAAPGASASAAFSCPVGTKDAFPARIAVEEGFSAFMACHDLWTRLQAQGMQLGLPETRMSNANRAWMSYNLLNVDKRNGQYEIHDGSGFYEEMYGYSVALFINALDLYGRHKLAERYIDSWLSFQQPDGLLTANYGLPDMGSTLLVMSDHYRFTRDKEWLKRVAPKMLKIYEWLKAKRAECMAAQKPTDVVYGLIKYRPYCDYLEPAYDYVGDAYAVVGMEATVRAFREIGLMGDASRIAFEAAAYRKDILASMNKGLLHRYGMPILDMEPETHRLLKRSQYKGGEYYGLIAPQLLETGFLAPNDPLAKIVTDFMEKRGGFLAGMSEFQGGVDHAYTYGYWLNCLQNGKPDKAVLGLYASMAGAISRETHSGVEVMHLMTGEPERTLPHTYSGTQQLRILRMMLVREEKDAFLHIGQGMPRGWLKDGRVTEVAGAPTLFGPITFRYKSQMSRNQAEFSMTPKYFSAPKQVRVWFRHPLGKRIRRALVNGRQVKSFTAESVVVPASMPAQGAVRVQVWFDR